jgi:hypothetical protein
MDTSKVYVDMCTLAVELQDIWTPLPWDYVFCRVEHSITCLLPSAPVHIRNTHWLDGKVLRNAECCGTKREHVWLPRQDQMVPLLYIQSRRLAEFLSRFRKFAWYKPEATFEQLYVRYWMELHAKKVWYHGEWRHRNT